jgi:hypothetical protein
MTGGVVTATGGQLTGGVLFAVPNLYFNTGDVVTGVVSIPVRAWNGCSGWVLGGSNEVANLQKEGSALALLAKGCSLSPEGCRVRA